MVSVHPRTRGEQVPNGRPGVPDAGSSPHTRGTGQRFLVRVEIDRFIPAHAGNRPSEAPSNGPRTVHPRTRGEQSPRGPDSISTIGSSPHTRGTVTHRVVVLDLQRFIPAHAGNSPPAGSGCNRPAVHPRTRGEQGSRFEHRRTITGSSPHTRGTDGLRRVCGRGKRFIPAHAGNRGVAWRTVTGSSVHPRTRGEQLGPRLRHLGQHGSSPHTRGTDRAAGRLPAHRRFIPAHAGNRGRPGLSASD